LILIDGIPGSGKSTTCQRLYRIMHLNGYPVEFYHEFYRPHPVLNAQATSISSWIEQTLSAWNTFIKNISVNNSIAILDGAVFLCGVGELLERDADESTIYEYCQSVEEIIAPAKPVIIYLYQRDIEKALEKVCEDRPLRWKKRVETLFSNTTYGRNRSLEGFELYLDFNQSQNSMFSKIFENFNIQKLAVDNSDYQWDKYFEEIRCFLGLAETSDLFNPYEYQGKYMCEKSNLRCSITVVDSILRVDGLFSITKNVLPKYEDTVFVQTWPDELTFIRDKIGEVISFHSTGTWNRIGESSWNRINI
jgi:hypothetical protein